MPISGNDSAAAAPLGSVQPDEAYLELHAERARLERNLALTQARQKFGSDAAETERAREEEGHLLASLDGILTQIRAAEYRRRPGARRW